MAKYICFIRENLQSYNLMHGYEQYDCGKYQDLQVWLCYNPRPNGEHVFAIQHSSNTNSYDIFQDETLNVQSEILNDRVSTVRNDEEVISHGMDIARIVWNMDNGTEHRES